MSEPDDSAPIVTAIPGLDRQKSGGWLQRLSQGLSKSSRQFSEQVTSVLTKKRLDAEDLEALEDMLVEADLGAAAAARVAAAFGKARFGNYFVPVCFA